MLTSSSRVVVGRSHEKREHDRILLFRATGSTFFSRLKVTLFFGNAGFFTFNMRRTGKWSGKPQSKDSHEAIRSSRDLVMTRSRVLPFLWVARKQIYAI